MALNPQLAACLVLLFIVSLSSALYSPAMAMRSSSVLSSARARSTCLNAETALATPLPSSDLSQEVSYKGIAVTGFMSKESNFAEPFVFAKLFETGKWDSITLCTDNVPFARKRLVSPKAVYSGLIDMITFASLGSSASHEELGKAIGGNEAWLAFNVSSAELPSLASLAVSQGVKRAVFAVAVGAEEQGADVVFKDACDVLTKGNVAYTIVKFGDKLVRKMGEAKFPFRIVRGALPLPVGEGDSASLSSEDLMRVLTESVDIPKTFNAVYGVGPGTRLDTEILVYMKSQGWPERIQVGLLMGDMMEKVETSFAAEEERKRIKEEKLSSGEKPKTPAGLPEEGKGNKFAGFFN